MRIIRVSVRRKRINVLFFSEHPEIDGEFSDDGGLIVDRDTYDASGYSEGDSITLAEVESLSNASRNARAYSRALWLLDSRDYTAKGMLDKLRPLYGDAAATHAVGILTESGFIDDVRFAERAAEFMLEANRSERDIISRLARKGVPYDVARDAVHSVSADNYDPTEQIKSLIEKKFAARLMSGERDERQKVIAALVRKGFDFDDIRSAINAFCDEFND